MDTISFAGNAEQCILIAAVAVNQLAVLDLYFIQKTGTSVKKTIAVGLFWIITDGGNTLFSFTQNVFFGLKRKSSANIR